MQILALTHTCGDGVGTLNPDSPSGRDEFAPVARCKLMGVLAFRAKETGQATGLSRFLLRPEGLEPPTPGSEDRYSIQLSYGRAKQTAIEAVCFGRSDGIRTRDPQDHNLVR